MTKKISVLVGFLCTVLVSLAQDHNWALGFYGDVQLADPYPGTFGVQGKYELGNYQGFQAQVHGRNSFVSFGADYIVSVLNKRQHNFNVFLGVGASQDLYSFVDPDQVGPSKVREQAFNGNGQIGVSYYFEAIQLSLYTGYKAKYDFKNESIDPNILMFGLRYHLW